jgi:hypothetical protein
MRIWWGVVCLLLGSWAISWAQEGKATISGFIYDRADGEALIGASVYIRDLQLGGISNGSGYYVITDVPVGARDLTALPYRCTMPL